MLSCACVIKCLIYISRVLLLLPILYIYFEFVFVSTCCVESYTGKQVWGDTPR
jgi:hypothetical protein